jgi:hypothetical protein
MNEQVVRLQAALNEFATQNALLRDRCAQFAADLAVAQSKLSEAEKKDPKDD